MKCPWTTKKAKNYQNQLVREIPTPAEAGDQVITNSRRVRLLEQYIMAIHKYKDSWRRFPDLEEYFQMVESQQEVPIEDNDKDEEVQQSSENYV